MNPFSRAALGLLAVAVVCLSPVSGFSTTVRSMNLSELVSDAQYVVKVKILSKDVVQDAEESGMIVSYYTLQVLEWLKGEPSGDGELVIKQVGQGKFTLDGYRIQQNYYFPDYEVGKTYVLFLPEAHPVTGLLAPVGLFQGVFDVVTENGVETVPQLRARERMLQERIPASAATKSLRARFLTVSGEPTYGNFKTLIQAAGE
jgi:hypothetical protein